MKNPEKHRENSKRGVRRWLAKQDPAVLRARRHAARERKKEEIIVGLLGGKCAVCGIDDMRVLECDHKHGDGNLYRQKQRSAGIASINRLFLKHGEHWLRENIQVLCANHHRIKTYEEADHIKFRNGTAQPPLTDSTQLSLSL